MRVQLPIRLLVTAAALAGAVGCGVTPAQPPRQMAPRPMMTEPPRFQGPAFDMMPTMVDPAVQEILGAVSRTYQQTTSVKATLKTYAKKGSKTVTNQVRFSFVKPQATMIDIYGSTNPKLVDTKLLWKGGTQVEVKTKFIGFPIQVSLDLTDDRLKDTRGYQIDEVTVPAIMAVLLDPDGQHRLLGERVVNGRQAVVVEVRSARTLKGLTHDVFSLDKQSLLPILREGYEGQTLVYRNQMDDLRLNTVSMSQMKL